MKPPSGSRLDFEADTVSVQRLDEQLAVVSVAVEHPLSLVETVEDISYAEEVTPQDHAIFEAFLHLWHLHRHLGWTREQLLESVDERDAACEGNFDD